MSPLKQRHVIGCMRAHGHQIPDCCLIECWCGGRELSHPETSIYLIGSLRNPEVPQLAAVLDMEAE